MIISIVVAVAKNGVIGDQNRLIWHISEDLKHFKALTTSHTVIMGRKSYESIGKPLPNRRNIIISRNIRYRADGCEVAASLANAIDLCKEEEEVFIIGGGQIYNQSLEIANKLYITEINHEYDGDTHFPKIDKSIWKEVSRKSFTHGEKYEYPFDFVIYQR